MSILLNGLYLLLLIFVSPWILWRSLRHGRYRHGWADKLLGLHPWRTLPATDPTTNPNTIWLHAVSVGEVQVLRPLIEMFESERPDLQLAISITTDSGMELAKRIFTKHFLFYTPFDFSWSIKRTLRTLKPKCIILAELELWPNWLMQAERIGCPVVIVNGRLSERSFQGYARIPYLVRACMRTIDWVGAQSESYAARFEKLGVDASRLTVTGNVKFDGATGDRTANEVDTRRHLLGLPPLPAPHSPHSALASHPPSPAPRDPSSPQTILLAGSTQSPEESIVLNAFTKLADRFPNLKLIVVPRHPERFEQVAALIETTGLPWARRSVSQSSVSDPNWRIFLGDSVGELRWWWGLADIGFVGGSLGDRGGQNMIEPCAYGVATCFGPNTRNFADIVKLLLDDSACVQLQSPEELQPWIESQLTNIEARQQMTTRAISVCQTHRGATHRTWQTLSTSHLPGTTSTSIPMFNPRCGGHIEGR